MRGKRALAAILMVIMLCSNTMSVFATSADATSVSSNDIMSVSEDDVKSVSGNEVASDSENDVVEDTVDDSNATEDEVVEDGEEVMDESVELFSVSENTVEEYSIVDAGEFSNVEISLEGFDYVFIYFDFTYSTEDVLVDDDEFVVYYSTTEDGTYELWQGGIDVRKMSYDTSSDTRTWSGYVDVEDVPIDEAAGGFETYYFKVLPKYYAKNDDGSYKLDENGKNLYEYGTASEVLCNAGLLNGYFREPDEITDSEKYTEFCLIDEDNKPIDALSLHVGESKKIGMGLVKKEGTTETIVPLRTEEDIQNLYGSSTLWVYDDIDRGVWSLATEAKLASDSLPIEFPYTMENIIGYDTYITGTQIAGTESDDFGNLYLQVEADLGIGIFHVRVPLTVEAAEEDKVYDAVHELVLTDDKDTIYQQIRDVMVARATGEDSYVVVPESYFSTSSTEEELLDWDKVFDFYEEREGMKPEEGDYLKYTMGDRNSVSTIIEYYDLVDSFYGPDDNYYYLIEITIPFITTADEEAAVDKKIDELVHTEGGALYQYQYPAAGTTVTDEEKINAIYNYITKNVSGTVPGNRTTPIYHTAYHALIKGSGTCEAFALLFTRLSREMGIASKVIMGTDAAAHTYNIVELDKDGDGEKEWYFIDCSTGIGLKTALEFTRAEEQSQYLNTKFIQNYMSKIVGFEWADAEYVIEVVEKKKNSDGTETESTETFVDAATARDYIVEQALAEGNEEAQYTYILQKGTLHLAQRDLNFADCKYDEEGNATSVEDRVTVDLNGNTLTVADAQEAHFCAGVVKNGTITIGDGSILSLRPIYNKAADSYYQDVDFVYKSTYNQVDNSPELYIGESSVNTIEETKDNEVILDSDVTIEKMKIITLEGNVTVNTDLESKYMTLGNYTTDAMFDITVNGDVTVNDIATICSNLTVDSFTSKNSTNINPLSKITVYDEVNFAGTTKLDYGAFNQDWYIMSDATKAEADKGVDIELVRSYSSEGASSYSKMGTMNISGSLYNKRVIDAENISDTIPMFEIVARDCVARVLNEATSTLNTGDAIATFSNAKGYDLAKNSYVAITNANVKNYFNITADAGKSVELEDNVLSVVTTSVEVSGPNGENAQYTSLKKAAAGLDSLAGKAKGTYTFTFIENSTLTSDITLPSYVSEAVFDQKDGVSFNFNGKVLKTSGILTLDDADVWTGANVNAGTIHVPDGTLALANVTTANVDIAPGACLIVDNLTQTSKGTLHARAGATLVVNNSAILYNPVLTTKTSDGESANGENNTGTDFYIYKTEAAKINLLGKLTREDENVKLAVVSMTEAVSAETADLADAEAVLQDYSKQTVLFDTKISKFPLDVVAVKQATDASTSEYNIIYQIGNTIYVGKQVLAVSGTDANGSPIAEKEFVKWSDAITYLNTYAHANAAFEIRVMENVDINEKLTMPKKATSVWIYAGEKQEDGTAYSENTVSFTYLADIALVGNTRIENIHLNGQKYDSKLQENVDYASALKLSGKNLELVNVTANLASVAGSSKTTWTLEDSTISVEKTVSSMANLNMTDSEINAAKAVSGIANLDMTDSVLKADSVTVTKVTTMDGAVIDCINKITLNDVVSNSEDNILAYGGNTSKNMLTIKGNIRVANKDASEDEVEDMEVAVPIVSCNSEANGGDREGGDDGTGNGDCEATASIRKNAITLQVKSLEPSEIGGACGYADGSILCSAVKAGTSWFVVGSTWDADGSRASIEHMTYKSGNNVACGSFAGNVILYSSKSGTENAYIVEGGYQSLQEALTDIDKLAISSNYYKLVLEDAAKEVVTLSGKGITFPSKTAGILITADELLTEPNIYFKGNLTLKSDVALEDINLVPSAKAGIALGKYELILTRCNWAPTDEKSVLSQISGTKGVSKLVLDDTALEVTGNVNNIGTLVFAGETDGSGASSRASLSATGSINIGNVELEKDGYLTGLAAVSRKKDSKTKTTSVTKIDPKITITGDVSGETGNAILYLELQEKSGKEFVPLNLSTEDNAEMQGMLNSGIKLAKANLVTYPSIRALQKDGNDDNNLIKSGGYLMYYPGEHGAELSFTAANEKVTVNCLSLADAVTEIDNYKTKRAYTISLTEAIKDISGVNREGNAFIPQKLTMPKSNGISALVLQSKTDGVPVELGYMNGITFTCDTTIKDIDFIQMVKVKTGYVPVDNASAKGDYPGIVTVSTGGYALDVEGSISFNTPITIDGKNKGTLNLDGDETINTWTNGYSKDSAEYTSDIAALKSQGVDENKNNSIIHGAITGFANVNLNDCNLILKEYKASEKSYKASSNKVINLSLTDASIMVSGDNTKSAFTVSNDAYIEDGKLLVGGQITLKNVEMVGAASPTVSADLDFSIGGTLTSRTSNATLITRLKGGKAPYLNVKSTVVREDNTGAIYVGVYPDRTANNKDTAVNLMGKEKTGVVLLTAAKALAEDFRPMGACYQSSEGSPVGPYEESNPSGYWMEKVKSNIYVYTGKM